jgi:hypothetical protein
MIKKTVIIFMALTTLCVLSGCVSKPDSDIFFICKSHKLDKETLFGVSYPGDFFELGRDHFTESDGTFCLIYYNKFETAHCHMRIFGPGGTFCHESGALPIPAGLYYFVKPKISTFIKRCGCGRYEAKLCRNGETIKTLEFYLEK